MFGVCLFGFALNVVGVDKVVVAGLFWWFSWLLVCGLVCLGICGLVEG